MRYAIAPARRHALTSASPILAGETRLKPVFVWWTAFLQQLPFQIILTLWSTLFFGNMLAFVNVGRAIASGSVDIAAVFHGYSAIAGFTFLAIPALFMGLKWANYLASEYRLFDDRIEFAEGFLTKQ